MVQCIEPCLVEFVVGVAGAGGPAGAGGAGGSRCFAAWVVVVGFRAYLRSCDFERKTNSNYLDFD